MNRRKNRRRGGSPYGAVTSDEGNFYRGLVWLHDNQR